MKKILSIFTFFALLFSSISSVSAVVDTAEVTAEPVLYTTEETVETAEESIESGEEALELSISEEDVSDITDEELLEAEPSELPEVEESEEFTNKYVGRMLIDVEGNGEVYYVDPVTGGKEYLADGSSAQNLLERRALGISEVNFEKLILGETKDEESVCEDSDLGKRLRGRIVLRTEENGEAYWIYPENCRAYYAGTHETAYKLMRDFSLGMKKTDLARVKNNARQKLKTAFRFSVFAYAEDNDVSLKESRESLKEKTDAIKECMKEAGFEQGNDKTKEDRIAQSKICAEDNDMPVIDKERRMEILENVKEVRIERLQNKIKRLEDMDVKNIFKRVKNRIKKIKK